MEGPVAQRACLWRHFTTLTRMIGILTAVGELSSVVTDCCLLNKSTSNRHFVVYSLLTLTLVITLLVIL